MKRLSFALLVAFMSAAAWAQSEAPAEKPAIFASQSATINAVVEAINHETREVTLRGPQGNSVTLVVGEEARNLGQVQVGDTVTAQYEESLSIELLPGDGSEPSAGALSAAGRAEEGEMPAGAVMDAQVVTATVEAIDIGANTFKLRFPDGAVQQFTARNPENLKRAEVGDMVVITATQSLALAVEKTASE